jgi:hypothetical protein
MSGINSTIDSNTFKCGQGNFFSKNGEIYLKIATFSFFLNKILKKNSSICKEKFTKVEN